MTTDHPTSTITQLNSTDEIRILPCFDTIMNEFAAMVRSATTTIYYSTFLCIATHQLPGEEAGVTVQQLFTDAANRGVSISILYNAEEMYGNIPATQFLDQFPTGVRLKTVTGSGRLGPLAKLVSSHQFYSNHHQKYLCVDGQRLMVTGCDINAERNGWLKLNTRGYYWHEVAVSLPCTVDMYSYICRNFEDGIVVDAPPLPLTASGKHNSELAVVVEMIENCKHFMHIEAQTCTSTQFTKNSIFTALIQRVELAYRHKETDRFRCFILTNMLMVDESPIVQWSCAQDVLLSRRYLKTGLTALGVPWVFVCQRVFMGTMEHNGVHIKIHSNLFIQDSKVMLRTSSNLNDRSFSDKPCDTEMGVLIQGRGDQVGRFQSLQLARYLGQPSDSPADFFDALLRLVDETTAPAPTEPKSALDQACLVKPIRLSTFTQERTRVPDAIVNAVMQRVHKSRVRGGVASIKWTVTEINTKERAANSQKQVKNKLILAFILLFIIMIVLFIYKRHVARIRMLLTKAKP